MKINYRIFLICIIGLIIGKLLNHFCRNNDMLLVVLGVVNILLAVYYYWEKKNQEWIKLIVPFAIACFMPVTLGLYSKDVYFLSTLGSVIFIIIGTNAFLVQKSKQESDLGKKRFLRIVIGINTFALLSFCAIGLYAFLR